MRTFFKRRAEYAIEDMENYLGLAKGSATVTVTRNGSGTVTADSTEIAFSGNVWTGSYESGKKVTFTAKPAEGYVFAGWSGAVVSDSESITITADKASALICTFKKKDYESGDINTDGAVNTADLLLMSKYLHGRESFTQAQFKLADMNKDKSADVFDLIALRRKMIK